MGLAVLHVCHGVVVFGLVVLQVFLGVGTGRILDFSFRTGQG